MSHVLLTVVDFLCIVYTLMSLLWLYSTMMYGRICLVSHCDNALQALYMYLHIETTYQSHQFIIGGQSNLTNLFKQMTKGD